MSEAPQRFELRILTHTEELLYQLLILSTRSSIATSLLLRFELLLLLLLLPIPHSGV
jgi:hypothetical protein